MGRRLAILAAGEVVVDADAPDIPVGITGETVMMATPVHCAIRPQALRVRVRPNRPGVRPPKPKLDWPELRQLASFRTTPAAPKSGRAACASSPRSGCYVFGGPVSTRHSRAG
jgi:hypothetical protein